MKNKGITLISLVVTVIVLLILAGISIAMLSGDNGLLSRAGQARDDSVIGQEKEQVELAYISAAVKKLGDNVDKDDLQDELDISVGNNRTLVTGRSILNVHFNDTNHNYTVNAGTVTRIADGENNNNVIDSMVKDITVRKNGTEGSALLLKNTGELYLITYNGENGEYVKYEEEQGKEILTGVEEYYEDDFYLTKANELCWYDRDSETTTTLANSVKKYYGADCYITTENELCYYDWDSGASRTLSSELKEYYGGYYITTSNELCYYDWDLEISKTVASEVKEYFWDGYYITTSNELCYYDVGSETSTTLSSGVKEYYEDNYYLTTENELCKYRTVETKTIDNDVKKYYEGGYYLTTSGELMNTDGRHASVMVAEHVKEFCGIDNYSSYYLTTTNVLCNSNGNTIIAEGVTRVGDGALWYETDEGEIYLKYAIIK